MDLSALATLGLIAALVILYALLCSAVGGKAAQKGRDNVTWFIVALLISPVLAFIAVEIMQPLKSGPGFKKCPMCAEAVQAEATICRFCRHQFLVAAATPPVPASRPASIRQGAQGSNVGVLILALFALAIVIFVIFASR